MKVLALNGSPRMDGNTRIALNEILEGIKSNIGDAEIELVDVDNLSLSGCTACNGCKENGGECIIPDDSAAIIQKIYDAGVVIFGTPVYFWGMSSQLKMVVDKLYSKDEQLSQQKSPRKKNLS